MGIVYQAHDPRLERHVAIKLLPPDLTRDETAKQRFLQEAKAASALDHPICTILRDQRDSRRPAVSRHGPLRGGDAYNHVATLENTQLENYLTPLAIVPGRLAKFAVQVDF